MFHKFPRYVNFQFKFNKRSYELEEKLNDKEPIVFLSNRAEFVSEIAEGERMTIPPDAEQKRASRGETAEGERMTDASHNKTDFEPMTDAIHSIIDVKITHLVDKAVSRIPQKPINNSMGRPKINPTFISPEEKALKLEQLAKLKEEINEKANLEYKNPSQFVFSDGCIESPIMFVGEAPGEEEVIQGKPFVGKSGQLLQQMLDAAGITRNKMYITNAVVWRPPLNRTPLPAELEEMAPYLLRHIEIIGPKILVLIGGVAYRCAMQEAIAISKIRGIWQSRHFCPCIINIFHPSYLLRSPSRKRETWADILSIRQKIIELSWPLDDGVLRIQE